MRRSSGNGEDVGVFLFLILFLFSTGVWWAKNVVARRDALIECGAKNLNCHQAVQNKFYQ